MYFPLCVNQKIFIFKNVSKPLFSIGDVESLNEHCSHPKKQGKKLDKLQINKMFDPFGELSLQTKQVTNLGKIGTYR